MPSMKGGWVYIMTNKPRGALYVGVTADIASRVFQHRQGKGSDFCRQYGLVRLVHVERYESIEEAIAREKSMKAWTRSWKLDLIGRSNPVWDDLFLTLNG